MDLRHELMDRAFQASDSFDRYVLEHARNVGDKKTLTLVSEISDKLGELYQLAGGVAFEEGQSCLERRTNMNFLVAVFSENEFIGLHPQTSVDDAIAFVTGYSYGANLYGCGAAAGYIIGVDDEDMVASEDIGEVLRVNEAVAALKATEAAC